MINKMPEFNKTRIKRLELFLYKMRSTINKGINNLLGALGAVIKYLCITHCALEYVGDVVVCTGPSMEPTIFSDDIIFTEHITRRRLLFKKGDIIISKCPNNPRQHICKRIVGMPGDQVYEGVLVPKGHVWLEGDNGDNSTDSRIYGPVPQGLLRGRAICKIWPLTNITLFNTK